jgi:DMSO/TMAO reductase YedYZ molybdopterin-dependent catalytic subunit
MTNDDDARPAAGAEDEAARHAGDASQAGGDAAQALEAAGVQDPAGDGGPQAAATEAPYGRVRYSRRRVLILGGAFAAGVAAVIAGLRAFGGTAATKVTDTISDQFGPFPVRSVEDVPDVPAEQWTVKVDGLVDSPLTVDHASWTSLQRMNETVDFHCVEGWSVDDVRWGGVAPGVLLDQAGVRPEARYAVFYARGGPYLSTVPLDLVRDPATVLADQLNGQPLPPKHGGPLRLVVPKQLGYKSVKWVERIELTDSIRAGYWESNGYPEDAPIPGA